MFLCQTTMCIYARFFSQIALCSRKIEFLLELILTLSGTVSLLSNIGSCFQTERTIFFWLTFVTAFRFIDTLNYLFVGVHQNDFCSRPTVSRFSRFSNAVTWIQVVIRFVTLAAFFSCVFMPFVWKTSKPDDSCSTFFWMMITMNQYTLSFQMTYFLLFCLIIFFCFVQLCVLRRPLAELNEIEALVGTDDVRSADARELLDSVTETVFFSPISCSNQSCSICLENFEDDDEIRKLRCAHIFHKTCVDEWLTKHQTSCPICRSSLIA